MKIAGNFCFAFLILCQSVTLAQSTNTLSPEQYDSLLNLMDFLNTVNAPYQVSNSANTDELEKAYFKKKKRRAEGFQ